MSDYRALEISMNVMGYKDIDTKEVTSKYKLDIATMQASIIMAMTVSPLLAAHGMTLLFLYGYIQGREDHISDGKQTESIEIVAAKSRLNHMVSSDAYGMYDADMLFSDIKLLLETLK